jgi:O-antigen/teichoic acid export membrane protein
VREVLKRILMLVAGNGFAQAVSLISLPFITRCFSISEVGEYNILLSWIMFLSVVFSFGFNRVVIFLKNNEELSFVLTIYALLSMGILCVLSLLLVFIEFDLIVVLSIFGGVVASWVIVLESVLYRNERFKTQSINHAAFSLYNHPVKVFSALFFPISQALLKITFTAYVLKLLFLFYLNYPDRSPFLLKIDLSRFSQIWLEHKDLFTYRYLQSVVAAVGAYSPVILLGFFYGGEVVAYLGIAMGVVGFPLVLIGNSILNVLQSRYANKNLIIEYYYEFLKVTFLLTGISVLIFLLIYYFGEPAVVYIFGDPWADTYEYMLIVSLWLLPTLICKPSMALTTSLKLDRFLFFFESVSVLIKVLVIVLSHYSDFEILLTLKVFSVFSGVLYLLYALFVTIQFKKVLVV